MILTRKQRALIRLIREGFKPADIARATKKRPEELSRLLSRAKRNLRLAGIDPDKVMSRTEYDLLDLVA